MDDKSTIDETVAAHFPVPEDTSKVYEPIETIEVIRIDPDDEKEAKSRIYVPHKHRGRHTHRNRHRKRALFVALGIFALSLLLIVGAVAYFLSSLEQSISLEEQDQGVHQVLVPHEPDKREDFYVLMLGNDSHGDDFGGRSDVIILAHIDPSASKVALVSIPRDTMVHYENRVEKINAVYAHGGAVDAVNCVSEFAGVPISHFVRINFMGLERLVDMLGGVEVNVPESVTVKGKTLEAGPQLLDGETALGYARERMTASGGDFGRSQAQRLIATAIIRKVTSAPPSEIPGLVGALAECISTDYSVPDIVGLALKFQGGNATVYSAAVPSYTLMQNDISYVGTMYDKWQSMMRRVDAGLDPNDEEAAIPEPQASDKSLGAATNSAAPRDYQSLLEGAMTTDDVVEVQSEG